MTARKLGPLQEAAADFPDGSVITVAGKADDSQHRDEVFDAVARQFGHLDILVNNAGINPVYGTLLDLDLEAARKILEVNLVGNLAWVQDACRHEKLGFSRDGCVVNISSVSAQVPSTGIGFYGVSKAAIEQLTRTLAVEIAPGVRVNAIAPAVVKTQFARALFEGREDEVAAQYPLGRLGTPQDIAAIVAFLASSDASWITGQVINADGGLLVAGGTA
jgi:NAD(P)-dependent dehydrogenase (short-subunit alcohol dehydrogenase family)